MIMRTANRARLDAMGLKLLVIGARDFLLDQKIPFPERAERLKHVCAQSSTLKIMQRRLADAIRVLHQRGLLEDVPDWVCRIPGVDNVKELQAFYRAMDAVVLSLFVDIFGHHWIAHRESTRDAWLPLPVVDESYSVPLLANLMFVPRTDFFSARLWPLLAHEVAHLKLEILFGARKGILPRTPPTRTSRVTSTDSELRLLSIDPIDKIDIVDTFNLLARTIDEDVHRKDQSSRTVKRYSWYSQTIEFICDAIAVHVMGPSILFGLFTVDPLGLAPSNEFAGKNNTTRARHAPMPVRIQVVNHILSSLRGMDDALLMCRLNLYERYAASISVGPAANMIHLWHKQVPTIAALASAIAKLVLPPSTVPFNMAHWQIANAWYKDLLSMPKDELSPRILLNVPWIKRLMMEEKTSSAVMRYGLEEQQARDLAYNIDQPLAGFFGGTSILLHDYLRKTWASITGAVVTGVEN